MMRRLFWRIFISFWAAMILIVAGVSSSVYWIVSDMRANPPSSAAAETLYREIERVVAGGGTAGLKAWMEQRDASGQQPAVYAFDSLRREILNRRPPPPDIHRPAGFGADTRPPVEPPRRVHTAVTRDGDRYWIVVAPSVSRLGRWLMPFGPRPVPWPAFVIAIVVTAATCLLLARYLSAPIDKLRQATLEVASGNLNVRVRPSLGNRRDELGLLASDFDHMSERLRVLLDARQQLMRDLSHELRSPLARLQVALGLARRSITAQSQPQLDRIELEAGRIDALVGQILRLSRLNDPSPPINWERLEAGELLESLVQDSNLEAASRGIVVGFQRVGQESCYVHADRQLLSSAMENVLRNAIHYSPDDGKIDVEIGGCDGEVRIVVMDRGPGVRAEELETIFEPFYRASVQGDRIVRGHGLGLAITHRIVAIHDGSVFARNRDGGGLTVEFRLPAR
jgi:two-component system OmpR family sensor kinase